MSKCFWLCFTGFPASSHHLSKCYYKCLFPTTPMFMMLSVSRGFDTAAGPSPVYRVTLPLECFSCTENYNMVTLIPPYLKIHFLFSWTYSPGS